MREGNTASSPMHDLIMPFDHYRVAIGPRWAEGNELSSTLHTVPVTDARRVEKGLARYANFLLHAGIGIDAHTRTSSSGSVDM